jgi:hypothetical protein
MDSFSHLTITPISKDIKSASYIDYNEQLARVTNDGCQWCWDDSRYNKAKSGEYFAFYFHGMRVVIHKILDVKPTSQRLPSWSKNIGQADRNVVELSMPIAEISWSEWQHIGGPESKMGTYTTGDLSCERPKLYNYLKNIINSNINYHVNYWRNIDDDNNNDETLDSIKAEENYLIFQMEILREKKNVLLNQQKEKLLVDIEAIELKKRLLLCEIYNLDKEKICILENIEEIDKKCK